ncbi:hypothetical protein Glove_130g82 [Diversispora epigaea]|uniref:Reverse transcriptase domain-containing protein n=1 Tax=Diversispora epigaea TaxID=1348612 RepID=A0A397J711_9GLOM|nr:hypothetical protein Glove_130g82 [Diversispora epigaea]
MENVRACDNKRESWIMFQDMSKAFDSVSIESLILALCRIRIPERFVSLIEKLLHNKENQVLTSHGNTLAYNVEDCIDQEDIISPLFWRIFYDPLVHQIAESKLGYTMKEKWISNLHSQSKKRLSVQTSVVAYVDDTNWIALNIYLPPKFKIQMPKSQMPKSQIPNPKLQLVFFAKIPNPKY